MARTYTYDPSKIGENGKDRMRLELGDTQTDGGQNTCALCDEEYSALIDRYLTQENRGWSFVQFKCLEAIYMRLSYETDYKVGPLSYSLSQRVEAWKDMYYRRRKSLGVPMVNAHAIGKGAPDGGHYFCNGMQENPCAFLESFAGKPFPD